MRRGGNSSGTSWASIVFGWLAALGASLILSGLLAAVVTAIFAILGFESGTEGGLSSLNVILPVSGLLILLFVFAAIGGSWGAGRRR